LFGLKENVIIGKLIPAGTGYTPGKFNHLKAGYVAPSEEEDTPIAAD
jgi:hypothetical protein